MAPRGGCGRRATHTRRLWHSRRMPAQPATSAVDPTCPFTYSAGLASWTHPRHAARTALPSDPARRLRRGGCAPPSPRTRDRGAAAPSRPFVREPHERRPGLRAAAPPAPDRRARDRHWRPSYVVQCAVSGPTWRPAQAPRSGSGASASARPPSCSWRWRHCLDLVDLVVLGDALVRGRRAAPAELVQAAAVHAGRHARLARQAASHVRAGSRLSDGDAAAHAAGAGRAARARGQPRGLRQSRPPAAPVRPLLPGVAAHRDEYDGRQHRADLDQWDRDQERDDYFDEHGWRIVRVFSRGIYRDPEKTVLRVHRALVAQGCPRLRRPSDEWRRHFPT